MVLAYSFPNQLFQVGSMQVTELIFWSFLASISKRILSFYYRLRVSQKCRNYCIIGQNLNRSYMGSFTILSLNCLMCTSFALLLLCFVLIYLLYFSYARAKRRTGSYTLLHNNFSSSRFSLWPTTDNKQQGLIVFFFTFSPWLSCSFLCSSKALFRNSSKFWLFGSIL